MAGVARPWYPRLGSSRASSFLHSFSRSKSQAKNSGLYKLGHGEKSVIWYWEFDMEKRYFHEFQTVDFREAMAYYKANKFTMWEEEQEQEEQEENTNATGRDGDEDNAVIGNVVRGDNPSEVSVYATARDQDGRNVERCTSDEGLNKV